MSCTRCDNWCSEMIRPTETQIEPDRTRRPAPTDVTEFNAACKPSQPRASERASERRDGGVLTECAPAGSVDSLFPFAGGPVDRPTEEGTSRPRRHLPRNRLLPSVVAAATSSPSSWLLFPSEACSFALFFRM